MGASLPISARIVSDPDAAESTAEPAGWTTAARAAALGIVIVGIAVRVRQFLYNRSLWNDEALLAANLVNRSFRGLLAPLSDNQGAPIGFLWAEKLAVSLFGSGEMS